MVELAKMLSSISGQKNLPWKLHLAPLALNQQLAQLPHIWPSTMMQLVQGPWPLWQFLQGTRAGSPAM